jgi:polysaccharide deacetylase 2 family uncharacterized protein YibQ
MTRSRRKPRKWWWALAAALVIVGGGVWLWRQARPAPEISPAGTGAPPTPWYLTQRPPSMLVTAPDKPILPDDDRVREKGHAYEEALAREVRRTYVPTSRPAARAVPAVPDDPSLPPWRRYAQPAPEAHGKPRVVVVIDDLGIDRARSARAARLPGPLTLSFLTYANDLPEQTRAARVNGHELMLHVAMEPNDKSVDPGPNVLLVGQGADEIRRSLIWGLGRFEGYVGINNHMGSRFTRDADGMNVVMEELGRRGLLFLDSRTSGKTVAAALAERHRVPFEERNIFLDAEDRPGEPEARLKELETLARRHGQAIAIGHPKDRTLDALAAWLPTLDAKGFVLVPASAVARVPDNAHAAKR